MYVVPKVAIRHGIASFVPGSETTVLISVTMLRQPLKGTAGLHANRSARPTPTIFRNPKHIPRSIHWWPDVHMSDDVKKSVGVPQIRVGLPLPANKTLNVLFEGDEEPREMTVKEVFGGKKAVLFGIPGAFTTICTNEHLPQYKERQQQLRKHGVELIACVGVNDAFVLRAWGKFLGISPDEILLLADPDCSFHRALGLTQELPGLGERALRYSMFLDNLETKILNIEQPGSKCYEVSTPDHLLKQLDELHVHAAKKA